MARDFLEVFVDESGLELPSGRFMLIYAAVAVRDLTTATAGVEDMKLRHGLPSDTELKWNSPGGDPAIKAQAKQDFIAIATRHCGALISCSDGHDKDIALLNLLGDLRRYCLKRGIPKLRVVCDDDAYRSRRRVESGIAEWPSGLVCESITSAASHTSLGVQFADLTAGSFHYRLMCQFGRVPKRVVIEYEHLDAEEELALDDALGEMYRWMILDGVPIESWNGTDDFRPEFAMIDTFNWGIDFHGAFDETELEAFHHVCAFYRGCLS